MSENSGAFVTLAALNVGEVAPPAAQARDNAAYMRASASPASVADPEGEKSPLTGRRKRREGLPRGKWTQKTREPRRGARRLPLCAASLAQSRHAQFVLGAREKESPILRALFSSSRAAELECARNLGWDARCLCIILGAEMNFFYFLIVYVISRWKSFILCYHFRITMLYYD